MLLCFYYAHTQEKNHEKQKAQNYTPLTQHIIKFNIFNLLNKNKCGNE